MDFLAEKDERQAIFVKADARLSKINPRGGSGGPSPCRDLVRAASLRLPDDQLLPFFCLLRS